ncbi:MAG: hypothetical protein ACRDMZ_19570 [Solirubrobacteraceae bacterium]
MSKPRQDVIAVDSGLVGKTIVEAVYTRVQERPAPAPADPVGAALDDADIAFAANDEARLEMSLRRAGYLARGVEAEMFEPAKQPAMWLVARLQEQLARTGDMAAALVAACSELARSEPVAKPRPDDPAAATWRVPGPGGHVRHLLARRTIEDLLQGRDRPVNGEPADLKIPWVYGFFIAACEEVLPEVTHPLSE